MKHTLHILLFIMITAMAVVTESHGQQQESSSGLLTRKNSVRITLGGNGIIFSGEYARILRVKPACFLEGSIGAGVIPFSGGVVIPHQITWNRGKSTNFLELGLGGSFWTGKTDASAYEERDYSYSLSPVIGYRKLLLKKTCTFRIFLTPLIHVAGAYVYQNWPVTPWGGISFGFNF